MGWILVEKGFNTALEKAAYSTVWFQGLHGGVRLPVFSGQFYARKIHPGKIQQTIMDAVPISYT